MRLETRAHYSLVTKNTMLANCSGLQCGDVLAVYENGASSVLRHVANGPPLPIRARIADEGSLVPLEPAA